jgi:metallophosphoesterase (TIGR00282 family)
MRELECPFRVATEEVARLRRETPIVFVDFHAEATAEKVALGWHLDGTVSAVIGTHTHVQTADERILPGGTGYLTDAGMTGPHDGVIGVKKEQAIRKFLTSLPTRFEPSGGDVRLHGVHLEIDETTGMCRHIERIAMALEPAPRVPAA